MKSFREALRLHVDFSGKKEGRSFRKENLFLLPKPYIPFLDIFTFYKFWIF